MLRYAQVFALALVIGDGDAILRRKDMTFASKAEGYSLGKKVYGKYSVGLI